MIGSKYTHQYFLSSHPKSFTQKMCNFIRYEMLYWQGYDRALMFLLCILFYDSALCVYKNSHLFPSQTHKHKVKNKPQSCMLL